MKLRIVWIIPIHNVRQPSTTTSFDEFQSELKDDMEVILKHLGQKYFHNCSMQS